MPVDAGSATWRTFAGEWKFSLLLLALLAMILVPALQGDPDSGSSSLLWGVVLLAAVYSAAGKRYLTLVLAVVAAAGFVGRLVTVFGPVSAYQEAIDAGEYGLAAVFLGMTIYSVFSALIKAPRISGDTVMGAICVYLLLGFLWANIYSLVHLADPGSFSFPAGAPMSEQGVIIPEVTFGYYSFVTLTTVGYGDVVPISYRARTLSWLEAVVGVSYMATVIAFLVSQLMIDHQSRRNS